MRSPAESPLLDFHGERGGAAERHGDPFGVLAVGRKSIESARPAFEHRRRTVDENGVGHGLDADGAVDVELGRRAGGQGALQGDFDQHRAVACRRGDARDVARQ